MLGVPFDARRRAEFLTFLASPAAGFQADGNPSTLSLSKDGLLGVDDVGTPCVGSVTSELDLFWNGDGAW